MNKLFTFFHFDSINHYETIQTKTNRYDLKIKADNTYQYLERYINFKKFIMSKNF